MLGHAQHVQVALADLEQLGVLRAAIGYSELARRAWSRSSLAPMWAALHRAYTKHGLGVRR